MRPQNPGKTERAELPQQMTWGLTRAGERRRAHEGRNQPELSARRSNVLNGGLFRFHGGPIGSPSSVSSLAPGRSPPAPAPSPSLPSRPSCPARNSAKVMAKR